MNKLQSENIEFAIKNVGDGYHEKCFSSGQGLLIKSLQTEEENRIKPTEFSNADIFTERINVLGSALDFTDRVVIMLCANVIIHDNYTNLLNSQQVDMVLTECDLKINMKFSNIEASFDDKSRKLGKR